MAIGGTALRLLSAFIALPFVLYLMWIGGWPFVALTGGATLVCVWEFMCMVAPKDRAAQIVFPILSAALLVAAMTGTLAGPAGLLALAFLPIVTLCFFLFRVGDVSTVAARAGSTSMGIVWAGGLLSVSCLRLLERGGAWVFLACILSWGSDTGAYFSGRWFGRHKLYEAVSPKKTWEGAIGGVVISTGVAFVQH